MNDMRCSKCRKKLAEIAIKDGTVSILCNHRHNGERCKTVNTLHIHPVSSGIPKTSQDVLYNKAN